MIPKECKRLAEVDFPIAAVSRHAAREKSIRHGHPSTLHLWWARRPLASSRAVLLALLWPDPCDTHCPQEFKEVARRQLRKVGGCNPGNSDVELQAALFKFIGDFANWDLSTSRTYIEVARELIEAAHDDESPLVVDPFAGGGSIPLEALRIGCEAFASDLNPIACLILRVILDEIPRHGLKLAEELRENGQKLIARLSGKLDDFYPKDKKDSTPTTYLWARTVRCEAPDCGAEIPLVRSFWLSKKASRRRALKPIVRRKAGDRPTIELAVFEPENDDAVHRGTATKAKATCLACGRTMAAARVRSQLAVQRGGANPIFDQNGQRVSGCRLLAVFSQMKSDKRDYRNPTELDYHAVRKAREEIARIELEQGQQVLSEELPLPKSKSGDANDAYFNFLPARIYGLSTWGDLFTDRQKLALLATIDAFRKGAPLELRATLGAVIGRCSDYWSAGAIWAQEGEFVAHTFGRHALPVIFDFAEANPIGGASGSLDSAIDWVVRVIETWTPSSKIGQVQAADARHSPLPDEAASVWFTDPPYYDAVPYSYLSNFFLVWLKKLLPEEFAQARLGHLEDGLAPEVDPVPRTTGSGLLVGS